MEKYKFSRLVSSLRSFYNMYGHNSILSIQKYKNLK